MRPVKRRSRAELTLTYLTSYEGMGIASVRCTDGCVCEPLTIDAHRGIEEKQQMVSIYKTESLQVQLDQMRRCVLELTSLEKTRSGGFKFKLSELSLLAAAASGTSSGGGSGGASAVVTGVRLPPGQATIHKAGEIPQNLSQQALEGTVVCGVQVA